MPSSLSISAFRKRLLFLCCTILIYAIVQYHQRCMFMNIRIMSNFHYLFCVCFTFFLTRTIIHTLEMSSFFVLYSSFSFFYPHHHHYPPLHPPPHNNIIIIIITLHLPGFTLPSIFCIFLPAEKSPLTFFILTSTKGCFEAVILLPIVKIICILW